MPAIDVGETSGENASGTWPHSPKDIQQPCDSGHESLRQHIEHLYGEKLFQDTRRLEKLRTRKAHLLCSLTFLLRCRDTDTIPQFLAAKRTFKTPQAHRIYNRLERNLLRERIHTIRKELANTDKELLHLHINISQKMNTQDWDKIDSLTYKKMEKDMVLHTKRQKQKFDKCRKQQPKPELDKSRTIINLTDRQLTEDQVSILEKGGNFAVTTTRIPVENIIANVESAIYQLPEEEAEEVRMETARILRNAKLPPSNITRKERQAIKDLNSDPEIIILPADKGNATVIMETKQYKEKIRQLLDPTIYKKLKQDPTNKITRKTNTLIKNSSINFDIRQQLCKSEALPPRLYGLPKIHKDSIPLRPIVSAIGSSTYSLAKFLATQLQTHIGLTAHYIKDSTHFIEKISNLNLSTKDILISFDVVSLFTKVPVADTLTLIKQNFPEDITALFHHCLTTSYFQWDTGFYEQKDGVAMGSPLSPVVANFYMEYFEKQALETAPKKPTVWFRYVDDTFTIWSHGEEELSKFLDHLNSIHPNIQFTMEKEKEGKLPFLDVLVIRKPNQQLGHTVYRKPTHTDRYLHKNSNHHPSQKRSTIKALTDRAQRICEPHLLQGELNHLNWALQANGYSTTDIRRAARPRTSHESQDKDPPRGKVFLPYIKGTTDRIGKLMKKHNLQTIYRPTKKIQQMLRSAKDKRDPLSSAGVYRIPCSCGQVYIGTTKRSAQTRVKEHERHCRLIQPEKSAIAEHLMNQPGHRILFENTKMLDHSNNYHVRLHREAIEIHKHVDNFNRKEETMKMNKIWLPVLQNSKIKTVDGNQHNEDLTEQRMPPGKGQNISSAN
ncbi:uncharacterized protein LOC134299269 [Anolis carolinensis]|uniref:uncharacterized protein LOC134299269 n=1 Tax=Anolis carolinensis TaxID=28377 RepID=UPI002F2B78E4